MRQVGIAAAALIGCELLIALVVAPLRVLAGDQVPVSLAAYLMPIVAATMPFVPREAANPRGITAAYGMIPVMIGVGASTLWPPAAALIAIVGIAAVVTIRTRPGILTPRHRHPTSGDPR